MRARTLSYGLVQSWGPICGSRSPESCGSASGLWWPDARDLEHVHCAHIHDHYLAGQHASALLSIIPRLPGQSGPLCAVACAQARVRPWYLVPMQCQWHAAQPVHTASHCSWLSDCISTCCMCLPSCVSVLLISLYLHAAPGFRESMAWPAQAPLVML